MQVGEFPEVGLKQRGCRGNLSFLASKLDIGTGASSTLTCTVLYCLVLH